MFVFCVFFLNFDLFQPLKINVDETIVSSVENILQTKFDKDEAMKNVFHASRNVAKSEIHDLLADFRSKRALG